MMRIMAHSGEDWCHLCGQRTIALADIFYPYNAEHGGPGSEYLRMCYNCAGLVINVTTPTPKPSKPQGQP